MLKSFTKWVLAIMKGITSWLFIWIISVVVSKVTNRPQGIVFLGIYVVLNVITSSTFFVMARLNKKEAFISVLIMFGILLVSMITALIARQVLAIDYYDAFQILTLGQCFGQCFPETKQQKD